ncbi:probable Golgi SNAP receptor complex member 2 [Agrilus planipennis]|uniref:Probable Golgi SNAP receptor complex member 2 n=1 Tax=Agrilus planipennis TaxID=224129 RepID=A0A1W4X3S9_AGRPL|nr:probable Golgi SNAP receptor complex member 2 [Agrilus planipennis]
MDLLYNQTNKLIQQTQESFQTLERYCPAPDEVESDIQEKITTVQKNCEKLDTLLFKVPLPQRQNAKLKCDQLKYDCKHLQAALTAWRHKRARQELLASERKELLNHRFSPNPDATTITMDYAIQQQTSLQNAHRGIDEMLYTGAGTLESLQSQRMTLKGAHRRIMDMANTLGLSNHTLRLIEKRAAQDKYVLLGGMLFTLTIIGLVIVYVA